MKKCTIFAAIIVLLTMASCNQDSLNPSEAPLTWNGGTRAEKNPLDEIDFSALDTEFFVTDEDVEAYIHFKQLLAEGQGMDFEVLEVVPLKLREATLAYLLNYNEGWEIIAADKRAPTILGRDSNGNLPSKEAPDDIMAWIENLELDVLYLRSFSGRPKVADDETWEKMLGCIDFWKALNADSEYIERNSDVTRVAPLEDPIPLPPGHWELAATYVYEEVLESIAPLINVHFHQDSPYNNCCPYISPIHSGRTPAGCVAIAGAQMAHYLHYRIGRPEYAPTCGSCNAFSLVSPYQNINDIDSTAYTNINVSNFSSTVWEGMYYDGTVASFLIAQIGKSVHMEYSPWGSKAFTNDLVGDYFIPNGVDCIYVEYCPADAISSLSDSIPIVLRAVTSGNPSFYHAFIADGFRRVRYRTVCYYIWIWDEPSNSPHEEYRTTTTYSSTFEHLHMNGGWGEAYNGNNAWYETMGDWNMDGDYFNNGRFMIWDFDLL